MDKRNQNIDVCKGMLIVLVVLGHSLQYGFGPNYLHSQAYFDDLVFRAIYSFHMPLFMLISGYFFYSSNRKDYSKIVLTKIKSIGVPFFFFCILEFVLTIWMTTEIVNNVFNRFINTFRYNMWFLSSVLINMLVVATVTHGIGNSKRKIAAIILILTFIFSFFIPDDLLFSRNHTFMFGFFLLGYYMNSQGFLLSPPHNSNKKLLVLLLLFALSVHLFKHDIFVYTTGVCILKDGVFSNEQLCIDFLRIMIGIVGCFWLLSICSLFYSFEHFIIKRLIHYGRISLGIYGFQTILFLLIKFLMDKYDINFSHNYLVSLIITFIVLIMTESILSLCAKNKITKLMFLGGR